MFTVLSGRFVRYNILMALLLLSRISDYRNQLCSSTKTIQTVQRQQQTGLCSSDYQPFTRVKYHTWMIPHGCPPTIKQPHMLWGHSIGSSPPVIIILLSLDWRCGVLVCNEKSSAGISLCSRHFRHPQCCVLQVHNMYIPKRLTQRIHVPELLFLILGHLCPRAFCQSSPTVSSSSLPCCSYGEIVFFL